MNTFNFLKYLFEPQKNNHKELALTVATFLFKKNNFVKYHLWHTVVFAIKRRCRRLTGNRSLVGSVPVNAKKSNRIGKTGRPPVTDRQMTALTAKKSKLLEYVKI